MKLKWLLLLLFLLLFLIQIPIKNNKGPLVLKDQNTLSQGVFDALVVKNIFSPSEIHVLKNCDNKSRQRIITERVTPKIHEVLGRDYTFHDYIFVIEKSSIHTCHRDANGSLFNKGQKYPSYTMLLYLDTNGGDCLATVPGSQDGRGVNTSGITNVSCQTGDVFLFDANMVHAGTIDSPGLRIQMKISHKDDLGVLSFYQNYHKVSNKENRLPKFLRYIHQYFTCTFPFISDATQDEVKGLQNNSQKIFSKLFYGDETFYDLKEA
jgi:hypothetical protein